MLGVEIMCNFCHQEKLFGIVGVNCLSGMANVFLGFTMLGLHGLVALPIKRLLIICPLQ
jgi:hypothetical protein